MPDVAAFLDEKPQADVGTWLDQGKEQPGSDWLDQKPATDTELPDKSAALSRDAATVRRNPLIEDSPEYRGVQLTKSIQDFSARTGIPFANPTPQMGMMEELSTPFTHWFGSSLWKVIGGPKENEKLFKEHPGTAAHVMAGLGEGSADVVDSFLSPMGVATIGFGPLLARAGPTVGRMVAGLFAVKSLKDKPAQTMALVHAIKQGNSQEASKLGFELGADTLITAAMAKHALTGPKAPPGAPPLETPPFKPMDIKPPAEPAPAPPEAPAPAPAAPAAPAAAPRAKLTPTQALDLAKEPAAVQEAFHRLAVDQPINVGSDFFKVLKQAREAATPPPAAKPAIFVAPPSDLEDPKKAELVTETPPAPADLLSTPVGPVPTIEPTLDPELALPVGTRAPVVKPAEVAQAIDTHPNLTERQKEMLAGESPEVQQHFLDLAPPDAPVGGQKGFADKLSQAQRRASGEPEPVQQPKPYNIRAYQQAMDIAGDTKATQAQRNAAEAQMAPGRSAAMGSSAPRGGRGSDYGNVPYMQQRVLNGETIPRYFDQEYGDYLSRLDHEQSRDIIETAKAVWGEKGVVNWKAALDQLKREYEKLVPEEQENELTYNSFKELRDYARQRIPKSARSAAMGSAAPSRSAAIANAASARAAVRQRAATQAVGPIQTASRTLAGSPAAAPRPWFPALRALFAPQTLSADASTMALVLRAVMGKEWQANVQADAALREYRNEFDKTPVPRDYTYDPTGLLPRNYAVMTAIDTGYVGNLTPVEARFARAMRAQLDKAITAVQSVSPNSLRDLIKNYMPRIWEDPESPANQAKLNALLSKQPWEGGKGFLKQRVLDYFTDGLRLGLKPVSDNPVDVALQKIGEMQRFVAARRAMAEAKDLGLRKFVYVYEQGPDGWRIVDDPSSEVYAPPTVTIKEAYDEQIRVKTLEMLNGLGIPNERLVKLGGKRWGVAYDSPEKIQTKFGGLDAVFWHEFGHIMDWRYPDLRKMTLDAKTKVITEQLRALADERHQNAPGTTPSFKKYVRAGEEKMANMFDAYLRAPDTFKRVAPDVYKAFNQWLDLHPEVKRPLSNITPSLKLGVGQTDMFVGGPIKLGKWMMPEGAAQVVNNYLTPGFGKFKAFRTIREVSGLLNGVQLAGFFHGQFVLNDSFYSGFGLAAYDFMNGKPLRAARELFQIPISPVTSVVRGRRIMQAIKDPNAATPEYRQLAQLAVETNLRAGHGNYEPEMGRKWVRAIRELHQAPSTGAAWETLWRAPFAAVETGLIPVMKWLVPNMKLGIFARMAERVVADNPGLSLEQVRQHLASAADSTEDRLGQVTYDNLFQRRAVKDAGQLAFRAYGWQLTKYRMIAGGTADWGRYVADVAAGRKPTATFRMTYLPAMVAGHAIIGATIMYLLTGKKPQDIKDYLFPQTGLKDPNGRDVRVSIADFVKDVAADWRSFPNLSKMGAEWSRKLAPFWNMAAEMYNNKDFFGTEIFTPRPAGEPWETHLMQNFKEGAQYMAKGAVPFTLTGGSKWQQAGVQPWKANAATAFGHNPAPRYAVQTPAESLADDIAHDSFSGTRTPDQAAHSQAVSQLVKDLATNKPLNDEDRAAIRTRRDVSSVVQRLAYAPLQLQVKRMTLDNAMRVWDLASDKERADLQPIISEKMINVGKGKAAPVDNARLCRYTQMLTDWQAKMQSQKQANVPYTSYPK